MISPYKGSGQITREKFLFYEMRTAARLMEEGLSDSDVEERIVEDNLFQYPTEKSIRQMAKTCIRRLHGLQDESLIAAVAAMPQDAAKQICLYEQDDYVAGWSESTMKKIRQILIRVLAENEYLDDIKADHINPVWLNPVLENAIRSNNDDRALAAFNCFS